MILSLLGEGALDPPIARPKPRRLRSSGGSPPSLQAPRGLQLGTPGRSSLKNEPRRPRSRGASYLLCSFSSAQSPGLPVGPSVLPSESKSAPRLTPWPPRGACTPWCPPRPPARAGLPAGRRASGGRGTRASEAGRGRRGDGRGGGAMVGRAGRRPGQRAASRSPGLRAGRRASGDAGREPLGLGGAARAGRGGGASAPCRGR